MINLPFLTNDEIELDHGVWIKKRCWESKSLLFAGINNLEPIHICNGYRTKSVRPLNRMETVFPVLRVIVKKLLLLSEFPLIDHSEYYESISGNRAVVVVHPYAYISDEVIKKMPSNIGVIHRAPMSWYYPNAANCYVFEFSDNFCNECLYYGKFKPVSQFYRSINSMFVNRCLIENKYVVQHLIACCKYGILSLDELFAIVNRDRVSCLA